ncbi:hypothetical protein A4V12_10180 [Streptomyces noursei]|nr:hypothetical protein A4V12_10180 [Streptomyces noursei]
MIAGGEDLVGGARQRVGRVAEVGDGVGVCASASAAGDKAIQALTTTSRVSGSRPLAGPAIAVRTSATSVLLSAWEARSAS